MAINITMPALSPTMEEGTLAKWLVKEGDEVSAGDVIAEIETDKATMEVEAVDEGIVAKLLVDAGSEGVKVNTVIAVLAQEDEDVSTVASSDIVHDISPEAPQNDEKNKAVEMQTENKSQITDVPKVAQIPGDRLVASPLARRIAKDSGIDLSTITGSGPRGRIIKRDVENISATANVSATGRQAPSEPAPVTMSDEQTLKMFADGAYDLVPHDNMRKIIARRLVQSKQSVPHFYLTVDCELDALLDIRKNMNASAPLADDKPVYKISVNDFIIKAMGLALRDNPEANVSWTEANMVHHKNCDVGVAVSIPGGLITPIVRNVENKSLSTIANEMKDLASRARVRKLKPEEYQGGSTAVSNLGMFGIREFAAVINPPQSTILAVGGGEKRAIVRDGTIVSATIMTVTLSTDHRAVDGVLGALLLGSFKKYIENPVSMLV